MRSEAVLDRPEPVAERPEVRDLLVLWQHPNTREIVPIGRFTHHEGAYSFAYTRAAGDIKDFRPLPGLDDLRRHYVSDHLPSVFGQRVMEPDRSDYAEYLRSIGLDPSYATPWEQIVHSGGSRAGDTLQFMEVPTVTEGRARARFLANGVRHIPGRHRTVDGRTLTVPAEQQEAALHALEPGMSVTVVAEEDNPEDHYATLLTATGVPVGYVPWVLSASIRELMAAGPVSPTVVRVGDPSTPPHLRLLLDLDTPAPTGFEFDRDGRWEPLPPPLP